MLPLHQTDGQDRKHSMALPAGASRYCTHGAGKNDKSAQL